MLGLLTPTDPAWVDAVEGDLDRMLSDHAHCEIKAAQSALALVARFGGEAPGLIEPLVALAREESAHYEEVQRRIEARDGALGLPERDEYVVALRHAVRKDHGCYPLLLDRLLAHALIEGRSCERFRLLSEHLGSAELRGFYRALMKSEAHHYRLFCSLAEDRFGAELTKERLTELARREGEIQAALPLGPTVHG